MTDYMKRELKHWVSLSILFGLSYLMGAFIEWNFNAGEWAVGSRVAVLSGFMALVILYAMAVEVGDKK